MGESRAEVGQAAHAGVVVAPAGDERGASGGAERRDVEVGELHPVGGQRIDVGCVDVGSEAAELGEAGVVQEDHEYVGRIGTGVDGHLEVGRGLGERSADGPLEPLSAHRTPSELK